MLKSDFDFSCNSPAVMFGVGRSAELGDRLQELKCSSALVITTESGQRRYASVIDSIDGMVKARFAGAQPHCPIEVARSALESYKTAGCDCVVSIGGGSTIGLGKFIAVEAGAVHVTLPTTLSGSEMTPLFGVLVEGEKRSRREPKALANTVIVDPMLAQSLPLRETATTGLNALAHCIEALYVPKSNPLTDQLALIGIESLYHALLRVAKDPADIDARTSAAYGATIGGLMVNAVGIGMHHRICHVLGGRFGVPHGETNGVVLPQVLAFNESAIPDRMIDIMKLDPPIALQNLARQLGAPTALKDLGVEQSKLRTIADECLHHIDANPRSFDGDAIHEILVAAWHGATPKG
jgi:alcohol dehydrogenase class IV